MNKLPIETRAQILQMLCEGSSMRSISRVADVSLNTVTKLLVDAGSACAAFHNDTVRNVKSQRVQCDEIWSFSYAKQKNLPSTKAAPIGSGDVWTWTAIDADTKLIVSWLVGDRDLPAATMFIEDLRDRLANRVPLTTDGYKPYLTAVSEAFGADGVDYGILQKLYGGDPSLEKRYSPARLVGIDRDLILGSPDIKHVSTSFVERQNLTMRMSMRRFTRLTNAFSKKVENHYHALALYFVWYNFVKMHKTLRMTPAMAADLVSSPMDMSDIVHLIDARETVPAKRGPYKKRSQITEISN
jgi:IS1 family transposase